MFTRHLRFLACLRAWLSEEQKLVELRKLRKQFVVLSKYRAAGGFSLGNYRDPTVRQYNNNLVLLSLPAHCSTMIVIPQQLLFFLSKLSHHRPVVTIWLLKSRKTQEAQCFTSLTSVIMIFSTASSPASTNLSTGQTATEESFQV